jgi:hypothetical protein
MDQIILPNICTIMSFYSLVSPLCPNDATKIVDQTVVAETPTGSRSWLRIVLWVLGIAVG